MLKVFIHSGVLATRNPGNQLAVLDIAYSKKSFLANYLVAMSIKGQGEVNPDEVLGYPRWSGSLWDLVARALTRILYRSDEAPPAARIDRRCAYATRMCVVIERSTLDDEGMVLATAEIAQTGNERGRYTVNLEEDILGRHSATFAYGLKSLQHADLVLRAICWALYGKDTLGSKPALAVPPYIELAGVQCFHIESLREPAKTGFNRFRAPPGVATAPDSMVPMDDYARFLAGA